MLRLRSCCTSSAILACPGLRHYFSSILTARLLTHTPSIIRPAPISPCIPNSSPNTKRENTANEQQSEHQIKFLNMKMKEIARI
eukprot:scaffold1190_cov187-Ochromonas_danica.AAC.13